MSEWERWSGAMATIVVREETTTGARGPERSLEFPDERITVRELIRSYVWQEMQEAQATRQSEQVASGGAPRAGKEVAAWPVPFERACEAFERRRVLLLVDERQATALDELVLLRRGSVATFLRLLPLVGG